MINLLNDKFEKYDSLGRDPIIGKDEKNQISFTLSSAIQKAQLTQEERAQIEIFVELLEIVGKTAKTQAVDLNNMKNEEEIRQEQMSSALNRIELMDMQQHEIMDEMQDFFNAAKNEYLIKKEELWVHEENYQMLEEELKEKEEHLRSDKERVRKEMKPMDDKVKAEMVALESDKLKLEPIIRKKKENQEMLATVRANLEESNRELDKELIDLDRRLNEIIEIPNRKLKDLRLYEESKENLEILIDKAKERQNELTRKLEGQNLAFINSKKYFDQEKQAESGVRNKIQETLKELAEAKADFQKSKIEEAETLYKRSDLEKENKSLQIDIRNVKKMNFTLENLVSSKKRDYRLNQDQLVKEKHQYQQLIAETNIIQKETQQTLMLIKEIEDKIELIYDREKLGVLQYDKLDTKNEFEKLELSKKKKELEGFEQQLEYLREKEAKLTKTAKEETDIKEALNRKVLQTTNDIRETQEDLAIKELITLDETKKQHELEKRLNNFKHLYETVKTERNKYVNMIQMTSQDRTELREHFKNMERELQLLQNTSNEKDKMIANLQLQMQTIIRARDKHKNKLNKYEEKKRKMQDLYNNLANEISKLTATVKELDSDVVEICKRNDKGCLQRNMLGQQLVTLNEELCFLYDKFNMKSNIIAQMKKNTLVLEKKIRLAEFQLSHTVARNNILKRKLSEMPAMANKLIKLQDDLICERNREVEFSDKLENLDDKNLVNVLGGNDLDETTIDTKLDRLDKLLNFKKEQQLEKEVIIEELETAKVKLTELATCDKKENLSKVDKYNVLKHKLESLTRKVMALVSELSIFQATVVKLELEYGSKLKELKNAEESSQNSLPPTPESEMRFLKALRDKFSLMEMQIKRKEHENFIKNVAPFTKKTNAERRVDSYITEIGLPKPYGKFAPFMPTNISANVERYRKQKDDAEDSNY